MSAYSMAGLTSASFDLPPPDAAFFWGLLPFFFFEAAFALADSGLAEAGSLAAEPGWARWTRSAGGASTYRGRVGLPEAVTAPRGKPGTPSWERKRSGELRRCSPPWAPPPARLLERFDVVTISRRF